ncbi:hypothetical protein [Actibacterium sp. 188UL27-1]|uniref:hypothetical protein n=1 Tax=Actibacterium sp. 188UL27-1 TaxID=2786961 RepID=UPI00195AFB14|nr:hypothetical protein [Actibacterium sp. 188UL27-1]MBM7067190.1 hypothetical protein [Actibacterium sp. 188UL27-1]
MPQISRERLGNIGIVALSLSIGVVLWHLATEFNLNPYISFENVPSPLKVFTAFIAHIQTDMFWTHIGVSMRRILISYSIATVLGIFMGGPGSCGPSSCPISR